MTEVILHPTKVAAVGWRTNAGSTEQGNLVGSLDVTESGGTYTTDPTSWLVNDTAGNSSLGHQFTVEFLPPNQIGLHDTVLGATIEVYGKADTALSDLTVTVGGWPSMIPPALLSLSADSTTKATINLAPVYPDDEPSARTAAGQITVTVDSNSWQAYDDDGGTAGIYGMVVRLNASASPYADNVTVGPAHVGEVTTKPVVRWDYTSPAGSPQKAFSVAVWAKADSEDTNFPYAAPISIRTFIASDGTTRSSVARTVVNDLMDPGNLAQPVVYSNATSWQVPSHLLDGDYVAYIQVADAPISSRLRWGDIKGPISWTQDAIATTGPPPPTVVLDPAGPSGGVANAWGNKLTVTRPGWDTDVVQAGVQSIQVDRSLDGGGTWEPVPVGSVHATMTGAKDVYDQMVTDGEKPDYRARIVYGYDTAVIGSSWVAVSAESPAIVDNYVLRDPFDSAGQRVLPISVAGAVSSSSDEDLGVFVSTGDVSPLFVSGLIHGEKIALTITVLGEDAWRTLQELRALQRTILLTSDMSGLSWWVRFDKTFQSTLLMSSDRRDERKRPRAVTLGLYEVDKPITSQGVWIYEK